MSAVVAVPPRSGVRTFASAVSGTSSSSSDGILGLAAGTGGGLRGGSGGGATAGGSGRGGLARQVTTQDLLSSFATVHTFRRSVGAGA